MVSGLAPGASQRLHPNVLAAALATKLARIAWTVLAQERAYESRITKQPEKKTLRFTKGMAAAPRCPIARRIGRSSDAGSEGPAKAYSMSLVGFPAEVCELE
jgi:hypothetical protein